MEYFAQYGLFFAKTLTLVLAFAVVFILIVVISRKRTHEGQLSIKHLNEHYDELSHSIKENILSKTEWQAAKKAEKKHKKAARANKESKKRIFVLKFNGDLQANAVNRLREEVTALLLVATPQDEVLVKIDSPGGVVSGYGLAASQLLRIREHNIPLIAAIDKVAASGGYMMACVASEIIAAPFAIIGSIGVVAQLPNFHRLLKKHNIDFEQITAGEYKRTLTMFGENTSKARAKVQEEVDETHDIFKHFVHQHRPQVDISAVATGEYWLASRALHLRLVDSLTTSDEYLLREYASKDIYDVSFIQKPKLMEKLQGGIENSLSRLMNWF
ncbi:MAG: protease SohB [Gammaproteobacteria bacterium]